eukprot:543695-Amphidinium_carterae.3
MEDGNRTKVQSTRGIQQGDPLSALAFAILMESCFRRFETRMAEQSIEYRNKCLASASIDDAILQLRHETVEAAFLISQETLAQNGLSLQVDQMIQTIVYQPLLKRPPDGLLAKIWDDQPKKDRIVLCGLPVWSD